MLRLVRPLALEVCSQCVDLCLGAVAAWGAADVSQVSMPPFVALVALALVSGSVVVYSLCV